MSYLIFTSPKQLVSLPVILQVSPKNTHCFAGVSFFNTNGDEVIPTAGSVKIEAKHLTNNRYSDTVNGTIDVTTSGEANWGGNVTEVKVSILTAIVGAETYQLKVVQNLT
ncbi:tail protein [Vibrio phage phi 3]|uniref:Tail protein n=1 Tax=Vibrio phage phi 3 TaxID=1589298 RepID=A0A0B5GYN9_9CAUD|nr:tail protein [Vibrio phage phi 3]AJF40816.1 tail protein [Vibrio phage phi 3]